MFDFTITRITTMRHFTAPEKCVTRQFFLS